MPVRPPLPNFPRLLREFESDVSLTADGVAQHVCKVLQERLGWPLRYRELPDGDVRGPKVEARAFRLSGEVLAEGTDRADQEAVVDALNRWVQYTRDVQWALRVREAELAAAVPVVSRGDDAAQLDLRLQKVLQGAAEGFDCAAAALYMLDDTTSHLKLRAHWRLPESRLLEPPRPLESAVADLEALSGHAVVIEDARLLRHWNLPEAYPAAVCVPVSTATVPLGTLWIFSRQPRDFSTTETNLIEIIAGRLAVELERYALVRDVRRRRRQPSETWQTAAASGELPRHRSPLPDLEQWELGLATGHTELTAGNWAMWRLWDQERFAFSLGHVLAPSHEARQACSQLEGVLHATLLQGDSPRTAFGRVESLLSELTHGAPQACLMCAQLQLDSGQLQLQSAGSVMEYVVRPHGWEPATEGAAPLAAANDPVGCGAEHRLEPGDLLLVVQLPGVASRGSRHHRLAEYALHHSHRSAQSLASRIRRRAPQGSTVLVLRRREATSACHPA